jgi:hypothetical protein
MAVHFTVGFINTVLHTMYIMLINILQGLVSLSSIGVSKYLE